MNRLLPMVGIALLGLALPAPGQEEPPPPVFPVQAEAPPATVPCLVFKDGRTLPLSRPPEFNGRAAVFWLATGRGPFTVPLRDVNEDATRAGCPAPPAPAPEEAPAPARPTRVVTAADVQGSATSGQGNLTIASASGGNGPPLAPVLEESAPGVFPVDQPAWERRAREMREPLEDQRRAVKRLEEQVTQLEDMLLFEQRTGRYYSADTALRYRQAAEELQVQRNRLKDREADWEDFAAEARQRGVPEEWLEAPSGL